MPEQAALLLRYKNSNSEAEKLNIKETLILGNMGYISYYVRKVMKVMSIKSLDEQDYYMEAIAGLIEGINKYDDSKNVPLIGYAQYLIQARIFRLINDNIRLLKFPDKYSHELKKIKEEIKNGARIEEVSKNAKISQDKIKSMIDSEGYKFISINDSINDSDTEIGDTIPFFQAEEKHKQEIYDILSFLIEQLSGKEQQVINRFYGIVDNPNDGEYNASIGRDLGLCRERIRQINKQACLKLKTKLLSYNISKEAALA